MKIKVRNLLAMSLFFLSLDSQINAQGGTWTQLTNSLADYYAGTSLLLSDGTVIVRTTTSSSSYGNTWDRLTPDKNGSYLHGTWTKIASMNYSRVWFASQVLKDGRVFAAGGEYGNGGSTGEVYDPLTNSWTKAPAANFTFNLPQGFSDANSEILDNGNVLVGGAGMTYSVLYNPFNNTWASGPNFVPVSGHTNPSNESAWLKLPDNSLLFVDLGTSAAQRYIPSLNKWVADTTVPVSLYDATHLECGAALLLPNGKGFFLGSNSVTAIYTPSGNSSHGSWAAGAAIPNGLGQPDGPSAMLPNGKILCILGPASTGTTQPPAYCYEYDYLSNAFTQVTVPGGGTKISNDRCGSYTLLDLPDGNVLCCHVLNKEVYIYSPDGAPLSAGKPVIDKIVQQNCQYKITGTQFNGISEGSAFGDDAQMATNYPIVRLTSGSNVYYARTFNWNSTGVQRGSLPDTTEFTVRSTVPFGTYSLQVIANGIASDPHTFVYNSCITGIAEPGNLKAENISVYPNPANDQFTVSFMAKDAGNYKISMIDILGRIINEEFSAAVAGTNSHLMRVDGIASGIYMISLQKGEDVFKTKIMVK